MLVTMPGTDTNVTPEIDVPIMPNATMYQGDFLLPRKKALLPSFFLPVMNETSSSRAKYPAIMARMVYSESIVYRLLFCVKSKLFLFRTFARYVK